MLPNNYFNLDIEVFARRTLFPERDPYAAIAAQELFEKVGRRVMLEKAWNWLCGRRTACLMDLDEVKAQIKVTNRHSCGLREIPLSRICGSQGRACDYDEQFHPLDGRKKERWMSIAAAWYQGQGMPPVDLVKIGDYYFVQDGNHRVSVARALGKHEIEADVVEWQVAGPLPWERETHGMVGKVAAVV